MSKTFTLTEAALTAALAAAKKCAHGMADAETKAAGIFGAMVDTLTALSGSQEKTAVTQWGDISRAFKDAYAARLASKGVGTEESREAAANTAWSRAVKTAGLSKPQTPEMAKAAAEKATQRKAAAAQSAKTAAPNAANIPAPSAKLPPVDIEANIAHIAGLIRAGKFAAAQTMLADLANMVGKETAVKAPAAPAAPKSKAKPTGAAPATAKSKAKPTEAAPL